MTDFINKQLGYREFPAWQYRRHEGTGRMWRTKDGKTIRWYWRADYDEPSIKYSDWQACCSDPATYPCDANGVRIEPVNENPVASEPEWVALTEEIVEPVVDQPASAPADAPLAVGDWVECTDFGDSYLKRDGWPRPITCASGDFVGFDFDDRPEWLRSRFRRVSPPAQRDELVEARQRIAELESRLAEISRFHHELDGDCARLERKCRAAKAALNESRQSDATHKMLFRSALNCVDQVFQKCSEIPEPILPDYATLGEDKFRAVVRLAKDYKQLEQQLDTVTRERDGLRESVENWILKDYEQRAERDAALAKLSECEKQAGTVSPRGVDRGFACGRHYLQVAGVTVAVEGDPCRDANIGGNWDKEKIESVCDKAMSIEGQANATIHGLIAERNQLSDKLRECEAQAAAMRQIARDALRLTTEWPRPNDDRGYEFSNGITIACESFLEGTAGRDLLAELETLKTQLRESKEETAEYRREHNIIRTYLACNECKSHSITVTDDGEFNCNNCKLRWPIVASKAMAEFKTLREIVGMLRKGGGE